MSEIIVTHEVTETELVSMALDALLDERDKNAACGSVIADWVSKRWPIGYDSTSEDTDIIDKLNWYLGSQGADITRWLRSYSGRPTLISISAETKEKMLTDEFVNYLLTRYDDDVENTTGADSRSMVLTLETYMVSRDINEVVSACTLSLLGLNAACAEEIRWGNHHDRAHSLKATNNFLINSLHHNMI